MMFVNSAFVSRYASQSLSDIPSPCGNRTEKDKMTAAMFAAIAVTVYNGKMRRNCFFFIFIAASIAHFLFFSHYSESECRSIKNKYFTYAVFGGIIFLKETACFGGGAMTDKLEEKCVLLAEYLRNCERVAVAFSGGVDSAFLLKCAHDALGGNCIAVTASSCFIPERELDEAAEFCRSQGIAHIVVEFNPLEVEGVAENPKNRCYLCKKTIFQKIMAAAEENGATCVLDGTNKDDEADFRPGRDALFELGVKSPLAECGFTKEDIRAAAQAAGLSQWNKPSAACLASRFVYGEALTEEKLHRVEQAEQFLHEQGFSQVRVRVHQNLARIEVLPGEMKTLFENRADISKELSSLGFDYVTLDLQGFRSGSMNV